MTDTQTDHSQLTDADVARLTKERRYDDIEQARQDGRLDTLLGVPAETVELLDRARHGQITAADVPTLNKLGRHELVEHARSEGRITDLNPTTEGN